MKRIAPLVGLLLGVLFLTPAMASAWGGAQVAPLSCPEIHFQVPAENGDWNVQARLGRVTGNTPQARYASFLALPFVTNSDGTQVLNRNVPGSSDPQVIGGFYLPTSLPTVVTVAVGNAANLADGFTYRTTTMTNCAAPPPPAPVTITIDRTVTNTIIQQVPATPAVCTSRRTIRFLVRTRYPGVRNNVGARVLGIDTRAGHGVKTGQDTDGHTIPTSFRRLANDRIQVTIAAAGHRFTGIDNDLRTTVWVRTTEGNFRTIYRSAVCRSQQGNPNDDGARTPVIPG